MEIIKNLIRESLTTKETYGEHIFTPAMIDFVLSNPDSEVFTSCPQIVEYCKNKKQGIRQELPSLPEEAEKGLVVVYTMTKLI